MNPRFPHQQQPQPQHRFRPFRAPPIRSMAGSQFGLRNVLEIRLHGIRFRVLVHEPVNSRTAGFRVIDLVDSGTGSSSSSNNEENNPGRVDNDSGHPLFEEVVDWEEVENRENLAAVVDDLTDDEVSPVEWDNRFDNMVTDPNLDHQEINNHNNNNYYYYNDFHLDDYYFLNELEFESENGIVSPAGNENYSVLPILPAAKWVVESLAVVEIENGGGGGGCAVCQEDIVVGEKAIGLACGHYYHGECIRSWLAIRNTCPVCRYELPTGGES